MAKTIKQIADEIGVTKQAVYKRFKGKLNAVCTPYAHTENGILFLEEQGEQIIKKDFENAYCSNRDTTYCSYGDELECSNGVAAKDQKEVNLHGKTKHFEGFASGEREPEMLSEPLECSKIGVEHSNGVPIEDSTKAEYLVEIKFLRDQIDRLQTELEKEREHNREKDRRLMDTLEKLAETQAALAVSQSVEKQKELAETLLEGQQHLEQERFAPVETACDNFKECDPELPVKQSVLRRILSWVTGQY